MHLKLPDRPLRLAFFGTPELARTILLTLLDAGSDPVVLVVCQPDRPKGRGQNLEAPAVKELAIARGIPLIQPLKMKDGAVTRALLEAKVELGIVAAFGRILQQDTLDAPAFKCWNVHASILPRHRGASPIQQAILSGDRETGVTLMEMTAGLDEGPMLLKRTIAIAEQETSASLTDKLAVLGAEVARDGISLAKTAGLPVVPQDPALATLAPLIEKEAGRLDLTRPAIELERRVRALQPWPGTWVTLASGESLRVLKAASRPGGGDPGEVMAVGPALELGTGHGRLALIEVQPPGKKPMAASDYLRGAGRALTIGTRLGDR